MSARTTQNAGGYMRKSRILTVALLCCIATPAFAIDVYLRRDLGTKDFMRYCLYSNDETYTVNSTEICPLSVDGGNNFGAGTTRHGFLSGEYDDGMTKVCVYDVLGERQGLRLRLTELCPLSQNF
jgi:hypothetical protein